MADSIPIPFLAKVRKAGVLRMGYAQTAPWFYKDAKTGALQGIFTDVVEEMCKLMQVKSEYQEVTLPTPRSRCAAGTTTRSFLHHLHGARAVSAPYSAAAVAARQPCADPQGQCWPLQDGGRS